MSLDRLLSEVGNYEDYLRIKPLYFDVESGSFIWLDTRLLPFKEVYRATRSYERVAEAIRRMEIRGAPAIGVSAAFGLALAALHSGARRVEDLLRELEEARSILESTRPTAYNLFYAVERVMGRARSEYPQGDVEAVKESVLEEAYRIYLEDIKANISIGKHGSSLVESGHTILTHCNTGALATSGFGTALGVVRYAWYEGKDVRVIATETRPLLQGARLTAWELRKEGIPFKLIVDGAAGLVLSRGMADLAIVGADRIVLTGHTANKIGTYMIALAASSNNVPFYVAAPTSTIQPTTSVNEIRIEERGRDEVLTFPGGGRIAPEGTEAFNPAFDITPPELIDGFITEKGVIGRPYRVNLAALLD